MAEKEGKSLNRLIQDALIEKAGESTEARLRQAYSILGEDVEGSDVEPLLAVQVEAMLND